MTSIRSALYIAGASLIESAVLTVFLLATRPWSLVWCGAAVLWAGGVWCALWALRWALREADAKEQQQVLARRYPRAV